MADLIFKTEETRNFICDVSEACKETNVGISKEECLEQLDQLPLVTNGSYIDGNTIGCRARHAAFAEDNPDHCPHISFEPQADSNGKMKCQESDNINPLDLFDEVDLEDFYEFLDDHIDSRTGYKILALSRETSDVHHILFGLVVPSVMFVLVYAIKRNKEVRDHSKDRNEPQLLANKGRQLAIIIFTWVGALVLVNGIGALAVWGVVRLHPEWDGTKDDDDAVDLTDRYHGSHAIFSETYPLNNFTDDQFSVYVGFIVWITCLIAGLGLEIFVWYQFLQVWSKQREIIWRFAQFIFPLMLVVALGLASQQNFLALPITVFGLWKFGFPETLMYVYLGLFGTTKSKMSRIADMMNGIGTIIHHSAAVTILSMLVVGVIPPSRFVYNTCLILVMQHWCVLLSYINKPLYLAIELVLEYFFEWGIFSDFQQIYHLHWTAALGAGVMIFAHWLFVAAAILDTLSESNNNENVHTRGQGAMTTTSIPSQSTRISRQSSMTLARDFICQQSHEFEISSRSKGGVDLDMEALKRIVEFEGSGEDNTESDGVEPVEVLAAGNCHDGLENFEC